MELFIISIPGVHLYHHFVTELNEKRSVHVLNQQGRILSPEPVLLPATLQEANCNLLLPC